MPTVSPEITQRGAAQSAAEYPDQITSLLSQATAPLDFCHKYSFVLTNKQISPAFRNPCAHLPWVSTNPVRTPSQSRPRERSTSFQYTAMSSRTFSKVAMVSSVSCPPLATTNASSVSNSAMMATAEAKYWGLCVGTTNTGSARYAKGAATLSVIAISLAPRAWAYSQACNVSLASAIPGLFPSL